MSAQKIQRRVKRQAAEHLTGNQIVAQYILGYLPVGYTLACERFNSGAKYPVGEIVVDGKSIASVPANLHGGNLPSSKLISYI